MGYFGGASSSAAVRFLHDYAGSDFGAQLAAAIAALPSAGGTIDARDINGAQAIASTVTIDRPVFLDLGEVTITAAGLAFSVGAQFTIRGEDKMVTTIQTSHATSDLIDVAAAGSLKLRELTIDATVTRTAGAYVSITGPGGATTNKFSIIDRCILQNHYIGISLGTVEAERIYDVQFNNCRYRSIVINNTSNSDQGDSFISRNSFASNTGVSGTAAIEIQSGGAYSIVDNKYFQHDYFILWNLSNAVACGEFNVANNRCDPSAVASFRFQRTGTGTINLVNLAGNIMHSSAAVPGHLIDLAADSSAYLTQCIVAGNNLNPGGASFAVRIGNSSCGELFIDGNRIYGADTATGVSVGTGISEFDLGANQVLCPTNFVLNSTPRGSYSQERVAFGIDPGATLTERLSLPNADSIAARNAANSAWKKLLRLNASDQVELSPDAQAILFSAGILAGSSTGTHKTAGIIDVQTSAAGIGNGADTTDDTLFTYTLPSNALSANGKSIRIVASGRFANTANNKRVQLFFAGVSVFSTGTVTTAATDYELFAELTRIDATHLSCVVTFNRNAVTPLVSCMANLVVTDVSANSSIIKVTGASQTTGAASDVLGYQMRTEFLN